MKQFKFSIILITYFFFVSCDKPEKGIAPEFIDYVDLFLEEASKRGQTYDYSDIRSIQFGEISDNSIRGTCNLSTHDITIDPDFWYGRTESLKTSLIFHELSHCVLDRGHIDAQWSNGICKSLMTVTEGSCINAFRVGSVWYDYYVDELFDTSTPTPDWYTTEFDKPITSTLIDTLSTTSKLDINVAELDLMQNFEFIATFNNWQANDKLIISFGEQELILSDELIYLVSIFLNRNPVYEEITSIRFVQYDDLDYIFIDDRLFLMDNLDLDFRYLSFEVDKSNGQEIDVEMDFQLNLLGE